MQVTTVPCLKDNYAYLLQAEGQAEVVIVDASEAPPVFAAIERLQARPVAILSTHHHADHIGGNLEILQRYPGLRVFGYTSDRGRIPGQTEFLEHEQAFELLGQRFRTLHIPGHTLGAVAYVTGDAVFTGDTLFCAGCGRLFEGTPADMYKSLNVILGRLPASLRVYCGHEYTAANLRFAAHVEPGNQALTERAERVNGQRARGETTMGATLAEERATNPFLRCDSPEIVAGFAEQLGPNPSPEAVLGALRAAKDVFK